MKRGLMHAFGFVTAAVLALGAGSASADSVGPYYATPSWDQTVPASTRFIVLSNFSSQAVLDRNTGLVWEKTARPPASRGNAVFACWDATTGGQMGWRLPKVEELTSLADPSNYSTSPLPAGHPFVNVEGNAFWVIDHQPLAFADQGTDVFFAAVNSVLGFPAGVFVNPSAFVSLESVLCVRGGAGAPTR